MPEAFKNHFNVPVIEHLARQIKQHYGVFNSQDFIALASYKLEDLELKARSNQIANALERYMPEDLSEVARLLETVLGEELANENLNYTSSEQGLAGWVIMPVADYVTNKTLALLQQHTNNNDILNTALNILQACTKRFSAEFAIRPLLRDFPNRTLALMHQWASHENVHVRRLVSEGTRPYLPWGIRLHDFANTPMLILPLLEILKDDESEYVRRSVANNLNDIAKDHPDLIADLATKWWQENNPERIKLVKHACRTLIKNGHPKVLAMLGYQQPKLAQVDLTLVHQKVENGQAQEFELSFINTSSKAQKLLIDYVIYHQKANGSLSPKVFKWTSLSIPAASQKRQSLSKRHSFKAVTTRKYYLGEHRIEVLINGKAYSQQSFILV